MNREHNGVCFAEVVVDVKTRETDRPYQYRVPPDMRERLVPGMRVLVPFGPRRVEGYVVGLSARTEMAEAKVKSVLRLLDDVPLLTAEMIELSAWMCERYLCTRLQAIQALLPSGLRLRTTLLLEAATDEGLEALPPEEREVLAYFLRHGAKEKSQVLKDHPAWRKPVAQLLASGKLRQRFAEKAGIKEKKIQHVRLQVAHHEIPQILDDMPERAFKQKEVVLWLLQHGGEVSMRDLLRAVRVSRSTVRALCERQILRLEYREERRDPYRGRVTEREEPLTLTSAQSRALAAIRQWMSSGRPHTLLLQGVTGSGKTEVYLQAIAECVQSGKQAIVLVPEISLTPQMVDRFKKRFGDQVAVLHSRLSPGERYDEWRRIYEGKATIAVGARSAVFAPFTRLGLLIMDEEHELSYKQEDQPKYHAREVAFFRANYHGAVLLLGSATPSLETRFAAAKGRITRLLLAERVNQKPLPPVEIIDMRKELQHGNRSMFSRRLQEAITEKLARQEQIILFLNRRGYSTFILCRACGYVARCPSCDVSLTYHQGPIPLLRCHYCGHAERATGQCPSCGSRHIRHFGTGTQKVEEELHRLFPQARVIRMDVDTTSVKGSHERLLQTFSAHQADILLGTQMIAKGLDFPGVTLVGIITADTSLNLPDFRATERTFQLLTQVAGRVGRHRVEGEVILQTYHPDHYAIQYAVNHDYEGFFQREIPIRRSLDNPPFWEMTVFTAIHEQKKEALRLARAIERWLRRRFSSSDYVIIYEATPAPLARLHGKYRYHVVVKYQSYRQVQADLLAAFLHVRGVALKIDGNLTVDVNAQMLL